MSPIPTDTYVPVIDISRHQGNVNFQKMKATGVDGLIIRSNHAHIVDDRCEEYVNAARAAGWRDDQLGFYTFANPKRATGAASGKAFVDTVRHIFGHTDTLLMLDIESYETESGGGPVIYGPPFAAWIREHIDTVRQLAPDATLIAYSNASFWNPRVGDAALAAELEWIVPRYPAYSLMAYASNPLPDPSGWAEWAWKRAPKGPISPSGVPWAGWQFSAGFNRAGPVYGCQSSDLDLNIVTQEAWTRWTGGTIPTEPVGELPPPPIVITPIEEDDVKSTIYTVHGEADPAVFVWLKVSDNDQVRQVATGGDHAELVAAGVPEVDTTVVELRQRLRTLQPVGGLNQFAVSVLGADAVADWAARSYRNSAGGGSGGDQVVTVKVDVTGP